jgi:hypothetical protein
MQFLQHVYAKPLTFLPQKPQIIILKYVLKNTQVTLPQH